MTRTGDPNHVGELNLSGHTHSVATARRFARDLLSRWEAEAFEWVASQLVTELATNAVIHAGTPFTVRLALEGDRLRLEVADGSPSRPRPRHYGIDATTGRGLGLIDRLSATWGSTPIADGKMVWCEIVGSDPGGAGEPEMDAFLAAEDLAGTDGFARSDGAASPPGGAEVRQANRVHRYLRVLPTAA